MKLRDPNFDSIEPEARNEWLVSALRSQIRFMRERVPFWHERLENAHVDERKIESLADLAHVPILTKEELRAIRPTQLVPKESLLALRVCRWTSGTTGRPTVNLWTDTDWAALLASTTRMLRRHAPMEAPTAFNAFSQGHVTGPLYNGALRRLGAVVFDRSHHPEDIFSTVAQADLFDFDTLVLPGRTARGKGVGLVDVLDKDPQFLARHRVKWWLGSSGTFDAETVDRARDQGVQTVSNLYGSSEFAPFALSCSVRAGDYHVAQGHVLVEVVDPSGEPVGNGRFGRVVVTHLRGLNDDGQACAHGGTQLLRLAVGDGAEFHRDPCPCGLTTPRLRHIRRVGSRAS
jgi:phenylacetate-CoA ligase